MLVHLIAYVVFSFYGFTHSLCEDILETLLIAKSENAWGKTTNRISFEWPYMHGAFCSAC